MTLPEIEVFHYPIRSLKQFESKVRNSGSGYAINKHLPEGSGFHKRYWYRLLLDGKLDSEYRRHFFDPQRLAKALATEQVIEDRTLSDKLQKRGQAIAEPSG